MNRRPSHTFDSESVFLRVFLLSLLFTVPLLAKTDVDFDPNIDFSKYKTFAFIGGVENLVMLPVSPDLINNRVHRAVARELTKKGLQEVQPNQNPGLVVRYWVSTSQQVNLAVMGNWGPYAPYVNGHWAFLYDTLTAGTPKEGSLLIDVIDPRAKNLTWRLYVTRKLTNADKDWNKADEDFSKGFESYPPSDREKEAKRKERAEHPPHSQ